MESRFILKKLESSNNLGLSLNPAAAGSYPFKDYCDELASHLNNTNIVSLTLDLSNIKFTIPPERSDDLDDEECQKILLDKLIQQVKSSIGDGKCSLTHLKIINWPSQLNVNDKKVMLGNLGITLHNYRNNITHITLPECTVGAKDALYQGLAGNNYKQKNKGHSQVQRIIFLKKNTGKSISKMAQFEAGKSGGGRGVSGGGSGLKQASPETDQEKFLKACGITIAGEELESEDKDSSTVQAEQKSPFDLAGLQVPPPADGHNNNRDNRPPPVPPIATFDSSPRTRIQAPSSSGPETSLVQGVANLDASINSSFQSFINTILNLPTTIKDFSIILYDGLAGFLGGLGIGGVFGIGAYFGAGAYFVAGGGAIVGIASATGVGLAVLGAVAFTCLLIGLGVGIYQHCKNQQHIAFARRRELPAYITQAQETVAVEPARSESAPMPTKAAQEDSPKPSPTGTPPSFTLKGRVRLTGYSTTPSGSDSSPEVEKKPDSGSPVEGSSVLPRVPASAPGTSSNTGTFARTGSAADLDLAITAASGRTDLLKWEYAASGNPKSGKW